MPRTARRPVAVAAIVTALALVVSACGSRIDPGESGVQGATNVSGDTSGFDASGGTDLGDGGDLGGTDAGGLDSSAGGGGTTTGGTAGGGDTGAAGGAEDGGAAGGDQPVDESKAGSCDGFENGPGITDSTITIGNASDISGPVPGLFETAQLAMTAYVAYFNATSDICGRKLELKTYDTQTDAGADQAAAVAACKEVFALVGSIAVFDSGGASTVEGCRIPDLRGAPVTKARSFCKVCFGAQSVNANEYSLAPADFVKQNFGSSASKVAMLYINAGASVEQSQLQVKAWTKRGLTFVYNQAIEASDFNYATFVQQLKDKGAEVVFFVGAYQQSVRLRQAMAQQGFTPKAYMRDPIDYNNDYVSSAGSAGEGTIVYVNHVPFEEARSNREMSTYLSYLNQTKPGEAPEFFGVFGWSAGRLFTEKAKELGGKLSRETMLAELAKVKDWTANGMHAPMPVGSKRTGACFRFLQLKSGKWTPLGGSKYTCNGAGTA